jgi:hypothetical protein
MTFSFHDMVAEHQTETHFASFGEPLTIQTSAGETLGLSAIIKVTEQAEASDNSVGVIVRAELAIPATLANGDPTAIKSTWKLTFRGQLFGIEALSPPVAGFIKVNAIALNRELTHAPVLEAR